MALPQFELYNKTSQQKTYYGFEKKSFDFIKTSQTVGLLLLKNNSFGTVVLYVKLYKLIRSAVNNIITNYTNYTLG